MHRRKPRFGAAGAADLRQHCTRRNKKSAGDSIHTLQRLEEQCPAVVHRRQPRLGAAGAAESRQHGKHTQLRTQ